MKKTTLGLAYEAGVNPFHPIPATLVEKPMGEIAATLLEGRNPYFDRRYRDRFGTKVHKLEITHDRLVLCAVESAQPLGSPDRRFRAVIFRCDGNVLYQTPNDRALDRDEAFADMREQAQRITEEEVLSALCEALSRQARRVQDNADRVLASMGKQSPPITVSTGPS